MFYEFDFILLQLLCQEIQSTLLNCFVLNTLSSKTKQLNVLVKFLRPKTAILKNAIKHIFAIKKIGYNVYWQVVNVS